jgi:PKD repeat protein
MERSVIVALALLSVSCSVDPVSAPPSTGPSEFAVSLTITATPDVIRQDGVAQSSILVVARDFRSMPIANLSMRLETLANGQLVDFGVLSSRTISTGADGRASVTYLSPPPPPATSDSDVLLTIRVTPIGTDYANAQARTVQLRLARPGVILPPNGTPTPAFFASPSTAAENESVFFDASGSRDDGQIVSYAWTFGDGQIGSGRQRTHSYALAGTYQVTLTVTDDRGLTASTAPTPFTVTVAANPIAAFTFSPTDPRVGTSMVFNAAASTVPTGRTIVSYEWEFGDGQQATGVAPLHTFLAARTYTVVLTVTDNTGRRGVVSRTVVVVLPTSPSPESVP